MKNKVILKVIFYALLNLGIANLRAQEKTKLNLKEAELLSAENYPLIEDYKLTKENEAYLSKKVFLEMLLPRVSVSGHISYQSEVIQLPLELPMFSIPKIDNDQYNLSLDIEQPITNFATIKNQKRLIEENTIIESQKLNVEFYKVKEQVFIIYFNILFLQEQKKINEILLKDIDVLVEKSNNKLKNGVLTKLEVDLLNIEVEKLKQQNNEVENQLKSHIHKLSFFIGKPLSIETIFEIPPIEELRSLNFNRPELLLLDLQASAFDTKKNIERDKFIPKVNLFFKLGYGKPGLNVLSNEFAPYYLGGVKVYWNLNIFQEYKNEKNIIDIQKKKLKTKKETFLFNSKLLIEQYESDIQRLTLKIENDNKILETYAKVINIAFNQLEEGVITPYDYFNKLQTKSMMEKRLSIDKIELIKTTHLLKKTFGD